jgi:hypothetical protein
VPPCRLSTPVPNAHDTLDQQASSTELVDSIIISTTRPVPFHLIRYLYVRSSRLASFKITTFFPLIIDVVWNPVRADAETVLSRELQPNELTSELLGLFALRCRIGCKRSDDSDNGLTVVGGNLL